MMSGRRARAPRQVVLAAILPLLLLPTSIATGDDEGVGGDALVANVQVELNAYGYDAGPEDGVLGQTTSTAIRRFQADQGLRTTGKIDDTLLAHIANPRRDASTGPAPGTTETGWESADGSEDSRRHIDLWLERTFRSTVGAFD